MTEPTVYTREEGALAVAALQRRPRAANVTRVPPSRQHDGRSMTRASTYCSTCNRDLHGPPTPHEIDVFLAAVEYGAKAGRSVGISADTSNHLLHHVYLRVGAIDRSHAAWLLWPVLKDRYRLPNDEWDGRERRMIARAA